MILNMKVSHLYVSPFLPEFTLDHSLLSACSCDDLGTLFLPERHPCTWLRQTVLHQLHHFKFDVCDGIICDFMWQCWNHLFLPIVSVFIVSFPDQLVSRNGLGMSHLPSFKPTVPFWILSSSLGNRLQFFTKAARQNSAWAFWLPNTSENLLLYFCAILTFSPHSHPFVLFLSSFSKLTDNFECLLQHFSEVSYIIRWTGSHLGIFRSSLDFLSCNCCRFWIFCWLNWVTDRGTYPVACAGTHDVRVKTRPCCLQGKSNQRPTSRDVMRLHLLTVVTVSELCSSCCPYMVWSNGNLDNIILKCF